MPDKKEASSASPQDDALEIRSDAMRDPRHPTLPPTPAAPTPLIPPLSGETPRTIDIFQDPKTAPEVSPTLLGQIGLNSPEAPPASPVGAAAAITPAPVSAVVFDDPAIDEAVDDIVASDGDALLAAEDDARADSTPTPTSAKTRHHPFKSKWTWLILVAVLLVAVLAVPLTRYKVLGLVIKKSIAVTVMDSTTKTPVSNAQVALVGQSAKTDGNGHSYTPGPSW